MHDRDITQIIGRYSERLRKYGVSPRTLGWNKDRANLRFEILSSQWGLHHSSILDVGCGFGDFYPFLVKKNVVDFDYLGIDINPHFIEIAKRKYPKGSFRVLDILNEPLACPYDYVFASGVFNDKVSDNPGLIRGLFQKFDVYSTKGFAANFLSNKVQYGYAHTFHADPSHVLNLCYRYANNIVLRNDYMPFEFTVFVNKHAEYDPELAVYREFLKDI